MIKEEKINDAIVNIRMAQAVLKFVMESGKFESKIVMDDMQDQSDGLDHVAQLLMDIRDGRYTISQTHPFCFVTGKEVVEDDDKSASDNDRFDSYEVSDKEAEDAMSTLANYCCQRYCAEDDCIFYDDNDCLLFDTRPTRFETREMREKTLHGTGDKADR